MRKVVAFLNMTLDGVVQGPAHPDEDRRGGFDLGGWGVPYVDEELGRESMASMSHTDSILLGRRTYEHFYSVWPKRTDGNPFTDVLNRSPKYVASRTLREPLPWQNSILLPGDASEAVAEIKRGPGQDIVVLGSIELIQSLLPHGLIDELTLMICPIVLGRGFRLFADGFHEALRLVEARPSPTGVIIATYATAGGADTGSRVSVEEAVASAAR